MIKYEDQEKKILESINDLVNNRLRGFTDLTGNVCLVFHFLDGVIINYELGINQKKKFNKN